MPKPVTAAAGNKYCQSRLKAAEYNPELQTRVGAVKHLPGVTEDSLKKYELDINRPPNVVVALMADAYNQPELRSWYCANECPLGKGRAEVKQTSLERTSIRIHNSSQKIEDAIEKIFAAIDDGVIDEDEWGEVLKAKKMLLQVRQNIDEVAVAIEKKERTRGGRKKY